ncbi:MAG: T9SS type A sorting domain-containing protein [Fluviicola sp.]|nr:T9SS type A sorting domain-containing protein [Fluviicola sp.]
MSEIRIFPNPSNGTFTIANMQDVPIDYFEIYDLSGNLLLKQENINRARYHCKQCLPKGVYIIRVYLDGTLKQQKLIVP